MENVVKREEIRATDPYDLYDLETNRSTSAENENRVSCAVKVLTQWCALARKQCCTPGSVTFLVNKRRARSNTCKTQQLHRVAIGFRVKRTNVHCHLAHSSLP